MSIELDHFFILTDPGAAQAERLSEIGLVEGSSNVHPGQGTANRRFCFADTMLELLYIRDAEESANGPASKLRIMERASDATASPFGLVVRRTAGKSNDPFPGWHYYPEYFSEEMYFHVGDNSDVLEEPLCICLPATPPAPAPQARSPEPFTSVTEICISVPVNEPSQVLQFVAQCDRITLLPGRPHCMDIAFGNSKEGQSKDLRPDLPLVVRW